MSKKETIGCVNHDCDQCKTKRTWVGLTDKEIDKTLRVYEQDYGWISFAKAIEAKLKDKNNV